MRISQLRTQTSQVKNPITPIVLDLGCGPGNMGEFIRPYSEKIIGIDLSINMLKLAKTKAGHVFLQAVGESLPIKNESIDFIFSSFTLRNFSDLEQVFAEAYRVLRQKGTLVLLDIYTPTNSLIKFGELFWFSAITKVVGFITKKQKEYDYLKTSLDFIPPHDKLVNMLEKALFSSVEIHYAFFKNVIIVKATKDDNY